MLGKTSELATLVKKEAPQIIVTHCFLHRHALASKTLPSNLQEIVDFYKGCQLYQSSSFDRRIFKKLCQEMGALHEVLFYHTEVRWLSKGQVLKRLMELRKKFHSF